MQVVPKIDAVHLGEFLHRHIEPGSVVISDALRSYPPAIADTYGHKPFNIRRSGLHAHLDEFTFRFNRRHSRARGLVFFGLLEGAVTAPRTTMRELIKVPHPHPA